MQGGFESFIKEDEEEIIVNAYEDFLTKKGEDGRETRGYSHFHPSAFGDCIRKMALQYYSEKDNKFKIKSPIDTKFMRICDAGHAYHDRMQRDLSIMGILKGYWRCRACGKVIGKNKKTGIFLPDKCPCLNNNIKDKRRGIKLFEYEEIFLKSEPEFNLQGHCDGIIEYNNEQYVIDFKTINTKRFGFLKKPDPKYVVQITIYMWLSGVHKAKIFYEDKNEHRIKEITIKYDEELVEQIKKNAKKLKKILSLNKIPKIPNRYNKEDAPCKWCDYLKMCYKKKL